MKDALTFVIDDMPSPTQQAITLLGNGLADKVDRALMEIARDFLKQPDLLPNELQGCTVLSQFPDGRGIMSIHGTPVAEIGPLEFPINDAHPMVRTATRTIKRLV